MTKYSQIMHKQQKVTVRIFLIRITNALSSKESPNIQILGVEFIPHSTIQEGLEKLSCPALTGQQRCNQKWFAIATRLSQNRRIWAALVRDVVNAEEASSLRQGRMPSQVQVCK